MPLVLIFITILLAVTAAFYTAGLAPWLLNALGSDLWLWVFLWLVAVLLGSTVEKLVIPGVPDISLARVLWLVLVLAFLARAAIGRMTWLPLTRVEICMLAFLLIAVTSKLLTDNHSAEADNPGFTKLINSFVFPFSMFFISKQLADDREKIGKILVFFMLAGLYLSLTAVCEHYRPLSIFVFPRMIMNPYAGIHWGRARGPFLNAAADGTVLGMILPVTVLLWLQKNLSPARKRLYTLASLLLPLAIFLTFTRACWLGALAVTVILAWFYPSLRKIFLVGMVGLAVVIAVKWSVVTSADRGAGGVTDQAPIYYRIYLNDISWRMFAQQPIFGYGLDAFPQISYHYFRKIHGVPYYALRGLAAHNTFLVILVEMGLIGFIPLMLAYYFIFKSGFDYYRSRSRDDWLQRGLVVAFAAGGCALFINMLLIDMRFFSFPNAMFFVLAGTIAGLQQRKI